MRKDPITGRLPICYRKWSSMLQRCRNPRHIAFRYYGAKGVTVCEAWHSYDAFYLDMGDPPPGAWLDRIDNTKGYEPGNCRWVTPKESAANRSKSGPGRDPGSLKGKARAAGLPYHVVYQRVRLWSWPEEIALTAPIGTRYYRPGKSAIRQA